MNDSFSLRAAAIGVAILVVTSVSGVSRAGDGSDWVTIALPSDITVAPNARGTTAMFQTPNAVHLFSGITKQWTVLPVGAVDFAEQYHSHAIVLSGSQLHGFSSRRGVVDTIMVSPNVTLVNGPVNNNFVTLAIDGAKVHAFSGLRGSWQTLQLAGTDPETDATGTIGLVRDGATVYAFGAHHGTFVPVAADVSAQLVIATETATAHGSGEFRAFSAQQNAWRTATFPTDGVTIVRASLALAATSSSVLAFSGLSGELAMYSANHAIGSIDADSAVATFHDGADAVVFGAGRGTFQTLLGGASTGPLLDGDLAFFVDAESVTPFSAITGAFGPTLAGSFTVLSNETIGFADGLVTDYAYTPLSNQWVPAPPVALAGPPILLRSAIVLPTASSFEALSARGDTWSSQAVTTPLSYAASVDGSTFVALDGPNVAHVFDARIGRFETVTGASALSTTVFRNTFVAHDASTAWGFGQPAGRLQSVALASPVVHTIVKTSIAILETSTHLHVYSAKGSLSQEGRYPEYYLGVQLGNVLRLHQVAPPGSALLLFVGTKSSYLPLPSNQGVFFLDPSSVVASFPLGVMPASGVLEIDLPLPNAPVLVGVQPHLQTAVLPLAGVPYMSTSVSPVLY